ncbi:hypothetical protein ACJMK2_030401 [Sinanodonta woodiana]|uniref:Small ribosomal subunit protein uS9m n=1 Tax=Sinanodonta woodiana TaxID=1069815 RepID=A0ABD3XD23_SINWO
MAHIPSVQLLRCFSRKPVFKYNTWLKKKCFHCGIVRATAQMPPTDVKPKQVAKVPVATSAKIEKISRAMQAYISKAKEHDKMIQEQTAEFEIGKRHLANIMGQDPDNFTQEDIDRAIQYLLPSSLFHVRARPLMKHPLEIIPRRKVPQFGSDGRPHHFLFYTMRPSYYEIMYKAAWKLEELKTVEDHLHKTASEDVMNKENRMDLRGSEWVSFKEMKDNLQESINEQDYARLIMLLQRIVDHPLSKLEEKFVLQCRKELTPMSILSDIPKPLLDEEGNEYQVGEGKRKSAVAKVKLWFSGSGKISINGEDISYFKDRIHREQLLTPLQVVKKVGEVDIEAEVEGGGPTGQSGAIRLAMSNALLSFVDKDTQEKLRIAGLLTRDPRKRERKKTGQEGARKKYTWKKR